MKVRILYLVTLAFLTACNQGKKGASTDSTVTRRAPKDTVPPPLDSQPHVEMALQARARAPGELYDTKVAIWTETFNSGDCSSEDVRVEIHSDGTGRLTSISYSRSSFSGDYWWWTSQGLDASRVLIWSTPTHRGPEMTGTQPPPRYHNDYDFTYPAAQFGPTGFIRLWYSC